MEKKNYQKKLRVKISEAKKKDEKEEKKKKDSNI